jgi:hypothetical protein
VKRIVLFACLLSLIATSAMAVTLAGGDGAAAQVPVPVPPAPPASPVPGVPVPGVPVPGVPVPGVPEAPAAPQQLVLQVGDTLRIDGSPMGCQVTRRGSRPVIECRRDGSLAGTYGTFISDRTVTVARFRSSRTAQTILTARHGGGWRACTTARRSRASTSQGCR